MSDNPFAGIRRAEVNEEEEAAVSSNPFAGIRRAGGDETPAKPQRDNITENELDAGKYSEGDILYEDAMREYVDFVENNPNVVKTYAGPVYQDPNTGERTVIPLPRPNRVDGFSTIGRFIAAPFRSDDSWGQVASDAADQFVNPKAETGMAQTFQQGLAEGAGDVVTKGAALGDKIFGTDVTGAVDNYTPRYDTDDSTLHSVVADGAPAFIAGLGLASKVSASMGPAKTLLGRFGRWAANAAVGGVAAETVASATVGNDEGTLLMGETAEIPMFEGFDFGASDADQTLEIWANTLTEGLMLGSGIAGGAKVVSPVIGFASWAVAPLRNVFSDNALEREVYDQISAKVTGLNAASSAAEIEQVRQEVANIIEQNAEVSVSMLEKLGTEEQSTFVLDTISSLQRGTDDTAENIRLSGVNHQFRQAAGSGNNLEIAQAGPANELQAQTEGLGRFYGGNTNAEQRQTMLDGADATAGAGRLEADTLDAGVEVARQQYDELSRQFLADARDDLTFGDEIKRLEDVSGTQIATGPMQGEDAILASLESAYSRMRAQNMENWAKIEGGDVEPQMLIDMFSGLSNDRVLADTAAMTGSRPVRGFLDAISFKPEDLVDEAGEKVSREVAEQNRLTRVEDWLQTETEGMAPYAFMARKVRPELSRLAEDLHAQNRKGVGQEVRKLIEVIDGPMTEAVRQSGDAGKAAAEAFDNAYDYYATEHAPMWHDGVMSKYRQIYDDTIARTANDNITARSTGQGRFRERQFREDSLGFMQGTLQGRNREMVRSLAQNVAIDGDAGFVADYFILDSLQSVGDEISRNGVTPDSIEDFRRTLLGFSKELEGAEEFAPKREAINAFLSKLDQAGQDGEAAKTILETVTKQAEQQKAEILDGILAPFFGKSLKSSTDEPFTAFTSLFEREGGPERIAEIYSKLETLPEGQRAIAKDGFRTAYASWYRKKALNAGSRQAGGERPVSVSMATKADEDWTRMFDVGDQIFQDQPEVMETLKELTQLGAKLQASKGAKPVASWSPTAYATEARNAGNRAITFSLGVLNPTATKARNLLSTLILRAGTEERANQIATKLLADPEYYVRLARQYERNPASAETKEALIRWAGSAGVKVDNPDDAQEGFMGMVDGTANAMGDAARYERRMQEEMEALGAQ